ncbi:hypothetical protein PAMP_003826 [Pampus punctatissimus]
MDTLLLRNLKSLILVGPLLADGDGRNVNMARRLCGNRVCKQPVRPKSHDDVKIIPALEKVKKITLEEAVREVDCGQLQER